MRVELSFDGPLVNVRQNTTGGRIKVEAQRGETGKVYEAIVMLMEGQPTDDTEWVGIYADGEFVMYAGMIPPTIRKAIKDTLESDGQALLDKHADERQECLVHHRAINRERLGRRRDEAIALIRRIDQELRKAADGEGFNSAIE